MSLILSGLAVKGGAALLAKFGGAAAIKAGAAALATKAGVITAVKAGGAGLLAKFGGSAALKTVAAKLATTDAFKAFVVKLATTNVGQEVIIKGTKILVTDEMKQELEDFTKKHNRAGSAAVKLSGQASTELVEKFLNSLK